MAPLLCACLVLAGSRAAQAVDNPPLGAACGLDVTLVLDESGSIANAGATQDVRDAATAFLSALADTGSSVLVMEFSTTASNPIPMTPVTSGVGGTLEDVFAPYLLGYSPGGWTNWDDTLKEIRDLNASALADLVVYVTDGEPTAFNNPHPADTGDIDASQVTVNAFTNPNSLSFAVTHADQVKGQGSHMLVVGVGNAFLNTTSAENLEAISGPDVFDGTGTFDIENDDVTLVADFADLEASLRDIAFQLCGSSVTVTKRVDGVAAEGWEFTADVGAPPPNGTDYTWVAPDPGAAAGDPVTGATDTSGNLTFQWDLTAPVASSFSLAETPQAGFEFVDLACQVKDINNPAPQPLAVNQNGASFDTTLGPSDIVTCDFDNRMLQPAIELQKTVYVGHDGGASCPGGELVTGAVGTPVTYCFAVTNAGETHLAGVSVEDPDLGVSLDDPSLLAPGADVTLYQEASLAAALLNTATASGNPADPAGNDLPGFPDPSDDDTAQVALFAPGLTIEKSPDLQQVVAGGIAGFTILVTNTGDVPLTDVVVTDPLASGCDNSFASLGVGATQSYGCSAPAITDFTNEAEAVARDPNDQPVGPVEDDALVDVINPGLSIDKSPDTQAVVTAGTATFTITVTNTGDVPLSNVVVTDAQAPDCDRIFASLPFGGVETYACTVPVVNDLTNVAIATGDDPNGDPVLPDQDDAFVDALFPGVSIDKSPDTQQVVVGSDATFTIVVTNTGETDLSSVVVSDPLAPDCDRVFASLPFGTSQTYTCTVPVATDFTNVASVTGDDPLGNPVPPDDDDAFVDAITPSLSIDKSPDTQSVVTAGTATFTITVTNTGDVPLSNVVVSDAQAPDCDRIFASLPFGGVETYACTVPVVNDLTNVAIATGDDPNGDPVLPDQDDAFVDALFPGVSIDKSPDTQQVVVGTDATFTIVVTNTGETDLSNVVVSDAQAPDCDRIFASLPFGTSQTYTCTVPVATDFTNVASVTGDDPLGNPVPPDDDDAFVDAITPSLSIDKSPDTQAVVTAGTATFTITVTNTGDVPLTNVVVSDAQAPDCDRIFASLPFGGVETYACTVPVVNDLTNVAIATGDDPNGDPVLPDDDDAFVDALFPGVSIDKSPDTQQVVVGTDATFTIVVTNTGETDLSNVVVSDAQAPDCDRVFASLPFGTSQTYTCTVPVATDLTNVASVTGDDPLGNPVPPDDDDAFVDAITPSLSIDKSPDTQAVVTAGTATFTITVTNTGDVPLTNVVVSDAQAPDCDRIFASLPFGGVESYACTVPVVNDLTNVAIATGDDPNGDPVSPDDDDAFVDALFPGVSIDKSPDTQQVVVGSDATFTIVVTNTGQTDLSNVVVSDLLAPGCDRVFASLPFGTSQTYSCTVPVATDLTNVASVTGDDPLGNPVPPDDDDAFVDAITPSLSIDKSPDTQAVVTNGTATFTITVTNTGDVPLTNVVVSDAQAPDCDRIFASLPFGGVESYACTVPVVNDLTNVAIATGDDPNGDPVSPDDDDAFVDALFPGVSIDKSPDTQQVVVGSDATFTIVVTNTGQTDLSNVVVSDLLAPGCDRVFASLPFGTSQTYSCTVPVATDLTNVASVTGDDPLGNPVPPDDDDAFVDAITPSLSIDKSPDTQAVVTNGTATFTITVTNTGDVPLTNVVVSDAQAPDCDRIFASLPFGGVESYACTVPVVNDLTNVAIATGDDPNGDPVSPDDDDAFVDALFPGVSIDKSPDTQQVVVGSDATFTIVVTNTGQTDLSNVVVSDLLAPGCDRVFASLPFGTSQTYSCTVPVATDLTNVASVTGDDPLGNPVPPDDDDAFVDAITPSLSIDKSPDTQAVVTNGTATFTITVTNTGDVPLTNVVVSDAQAPDCDRIFASLPFGGVESYACTVPVVNDLTNVAIATGDDPNGDPVPPVQDDAFVDALVPAIAIDKSPDTQLVVVGRSALFTIEVSNVGQVDLTNVVVTDALAPDCDRTIAAIAVGTSETYTCTVQVLDDFTNVALASGEDPVGGFVGPVSDDAAVIAIDPSLSIQKSPDDQDVVFDNDAGFTIEVTNTGDVPLTNVTVTDPLAPDCDRTFPLLAIGASEIYTCQVTVDVSFVNVATATASDPNGDPVGPVEDDANVNAVPPPVIAAVPATSLVGLAVLALLLGLAMSLVIRRQLS